MKLSVSLSVNGRVHPVEIAPDTSLLVVLRDEIELTGTKEGCTDSECGACMVMLDGRPVNSCSYLALQAVGSEVTTVEGLREDGRLHRLQEAFVYQGGVQCGFCTSGMLISATALLDQNPQPTGNDIRTALAGNLCRCTGYQGIIRAVALAAGNSSPA